MQGHNDWLSIALDDLECAKILFECERFGKVVYFSQQCAEKALKTYLVYNQQKIRKTHDLIELLKDCFNFDPEFWKLLNCARYLNPFSTKFRYPDDEPYLDSSDAALAIRKSEEVLNFVKSKIK